MSDFYMLDNRKAVRCDLHTWGETMGVPDARRVGDTIIGNLRISTMFLGLDHQLGHGPPLLFESMAFGLPKDEDEWRERCTTWEQAEAMHAAMCERAHALL